MRERKSCSFKIPVTAIKHYLFCPRIPYFVLVLGVKERTTDYIIEGLREHKKFYKHREFSNVYLESEKLRIHGYVDAIVKCENGYKVVEYKNAKFKKRILKSHLYQAVAYALLVEENFGRVISVILEYEDRILEFPLTLNLKNYVKHIMNKIIEICETGLVPDFKDCRRCKNCGYLWICKQA